MGGEEMHNSSEIGMALLQYHKATLKLLYGLHPEQKRASNAVLELPSVGAIVQLVNARHVQRRECQHVTQKSGGSERGGQKEGRARKTEGGEGGSWQTCMEFVQMKLGASQRKSHERAIRQGDTNFMSMTLELGDCFVPSGIRQEVMPSVDGCCLVHQAKASYCCCLSQLHAWS